MLEEIRIGKARLTAFLDAVNLITPDLIPQADCAEGHQLYEKYGLTPDQPIPSPMQAFLLAVPRAQGGEEFYLIDAGCGNGMGPRFGKSYAAFLNAGYDPRAVSKICLTHFHPDHAGGLIDQDGAPRYPNAELYLSRLEFVFWNNAFNASRYPELKPYFGSAEKVLQAYQGKVHPTEWGAEVASGVRLVALPGHTPGHSGVLIENDGERLLIWGDMIHAAEFQLPHPEWCIGYDLDREAALKTRFETLRKLSQEDTRAAGPHVFGHGLIRENGKGGYEMREAESGLSKKV